MSSGGYEGKQLEVCVNYCVSKSINLIFQISAVEEGKDNWWCILESKVVFLRKNLLKLKGNLTEKPYL